MTNICPHSHPSAIFPPNDEVSVLEGNMALKRIASGIYRREDGCIQVVAQVWGIPGNRKRLLPKGTDLAQAAKVRKDLIRELRGTNVTESTLTFGVYIDLYLQSAGEHAHNSMVEQMRADLGHLPIPEVQDAFLRFLERQEQRGKLKWRKVDDKLKLCDTGKPLSKASIKAYKRYFSAICGHAESVTVPKEIRLSVADNPANGIQIGKADRRDRPILPKERKDILEVAVHMYPWFVPAIEFSRTMPIRPEDLCRLTWDMIDELHNQIPYLPGKTEETNNYAYPLILPHMSEYIMGRIGDEECSTIFYHELKGKRYPLTYSRIDSAWGLIKREAGISDLRFYDLRHDAVNYLRGIGFQDSDIQHMAGWSSIAMVQHYDSGDRIRMAERAKDLLEKQSAKKSAKSLHIKQAM